MAKSKYSPKRSDKDIIVSDKALDISEFLSIPVVDIETPIIGDYTDYDGRFLYNKFDKKLYIRDNNSWQVYSSDINNIFINVKDYGAVGDGIVDDTAAIQAAYDAVSDHKKVVWYPSGKFLISEEISIDGQVMSWGSGGGMPYSYTQTSKVNDATQIIQSDGTKCAFVVNENGCVFQDMNIINSSVTAPTSTSSGIKFNRGSSMRVYRCSVAQFYNNIELVNGLEWQISSCEVTNAVNHNIHIDHVLISDEGDAVISDCWILGGKYATTIGIYHRTGGGLKITNIKMHSTFNGVDYGFPMKGMIQAEIKAPGSSIFLLSNSSFENYTDFGVKITNELGAGFGKINISNNQFGSFQSLAGVTTIYVKGFSSGQIIDGVQITNNNITAYNNTLPHIYLENVGNYLVYGNEMLYASNKFQAVNSTPYLFDVYNPSNLVGNSNITGTLGVTGNTTIGGIASITGNTTIGGNASVTGTASVTGITTLSNRLNLGASSVAGLNFYNTLSNTGATTSYSNYTNSVVQSDVTVSAHGYRTFFGTAANVFTLPSMYHFRATEATKGVGSIITSQYGFYGDVMTNATNNYIFYGNNSAATGRWNLYMNGTASNYMNGNTLIGTTSDNGEKLQVNGKATVSTAPTNATDVVRKTELDLKLALTGGTVSRNVADATTLLTLNNAHASNTGAIAAFQFVGGTGSSVSNNFFYNGPGIANFTSSSNSRIRTATVGTIIDRNVADAEDVVTINNINASSTGLNLDLQNAGTTTASISKTGIITSSQYRLSALNTEPVSATDTGTLGEVRITSTFIYVCTATNTWVRTALTTW